MKKNSYLLFAFPAAVPLLLILFSFLKSHWGWCLVNDYQYLTLGTNFWDKLCKIYVYFLGMGQLKWTHHFRYAFVYTVFAHNPKWFFLYQWGEIVAMCGVWGMVAYRLTGEKITFLLFPTVVLTSRCFYDAFFFPTLGDNFAMLIFGLGLLALVRAESLAIGQPNSTLRNRLWLYVLVFFFLALGAMEFTLAGIMAVGCALGWLYQVRRDFRLLMTGIFLVMVGLLYGVFLKTCIAHGYSSAYSLTDAHKIIFNVMMWAKEVFKIESIWLVAGGGIIFKSWGRGFWLKYSISERFGIFLAVLMYVLWLAVLLPWHANGYHAVPLVIVFGFLVTVLLARPLKGLDERWFAAIVAGALFFNLFFAQQEIYIARTYNSDIQRLLYFVEGNSSFQQAALAEKVFCNQIEPAESLPHWANKQAGLSLKRFIYEPDVLSADSKGAGYFVFITLGQPLGTYLNAPGWEPVFVGEFCKVYKKRGFLRAG